MKTPILLLITILFSLASEIKAQSHDQPSTILAPCEKSMTLSRAPYVSFFWGGDGGYGPWWTTEEVSLEKNQELILKLDAINTQYLSSSLSYEIYDGTYFEYWTATAKNVLEPKGNADDVNFLIYHFKATNNSGIAYIYFYYCDRFHPNKYYLRPCIKVTVQ